MAAAEKFLSIGMAGLVLAIHAFPTGSVKDVDARAKPGQAGVLVKKFLAPVGFRFPRSS